MLKFMKNRILIPMLLLTGTAAFFSFKYSAAKGRSSDERRILAIETVMKTIDGVHFSPKALDDTFSSRVYNRCVTAFDYEKIYFTQQDINQLKAYRFSIDDQIRARSIEFFDTLDAIFLRRVAGAPKYYEQALIKPFSFTVNEEIQLNADKETYAASEKEMMEKWRLHAKYQVLSKYVDLKKEQDKKKENKDSVNVKLKTDAELEIAARDEVRKNYTRYFKRVNQRKDNDRFTFYVNAIAETEDPHTSYFPPVDKKAFDEQMSGTFFGIGAQLSPENDKVTVKSIITGSPSWKQGELKENDEILKVAQGSKEPVDIKGYELDDVVKLIRGPNGTEVRLTVKKADGSTKVIPIIRGIVEREEIFAKSAIIKGENGPIGYIYLPEFYGDFNHTSGRTCSIDVLNEVQKLKNSGVKGIILDLRNNGGGSLGDVVDMSGIFIGNGPVVQVKSNHSAPSVLRAQPGDSIMYKGPLAIMVNENSASASEILAAVLQDYKRAVIVGAMTYGKGTVQKMVDLDAVVDPMTRLQLQSDTAGGQEPSLGSLKLTMEKFYRVNGGSTQLKGVTPDIALPDVWDGYDDEELGERHNKSALAWDEIPAANYAKSNSLNNLQQVIAMSQSRINSNPTFTLIKENSEYMKKKKDDNRVSLNEVKYKKEQEELNATSKKLEDLQKKSTLLEMTNTAADMDKINLDSASIAKNKEWLKNLSKDIYIS
ncbi:MAG: carboxyl-terminal protease, partial [Flavipsychrobacter sp.]|nr:carboxyl-terminal protease [Flavipsychrobacter sp.]